MRPLQGRYLMSADQLNKLQLYSKNNVGVLSLLDRIWSQEVFMSRRVLREDVIDFRMLAIDIVSERGDLQIQPLLPSPKKTVVTIKKS